MTTTTPESRGAIAYVAYCRRVGFRSVTSEELPSFAELDNERQQAWIASADVIWQLATKGHATL